MSFGIPLMVARNRALDCTNDFNISSFPLIDKLSVFHALSTSFCFLSIWFHCVTWLVLLPI